MEPFQPILCILSTLGSHCLAVQQPRAGGCHRCLHANTAAQLRVQISFVSSVLTLTLKEGDVGYFMYNVFILFPFNLGFATGIKG